jgi:O-antigen ligase
LLALAFFTGALLCIAPLRERLVTSWDTGYALNVERTHLWEAGHALFQERPIAGWGLRSLEPVIETHRPPEAHERLTHLHSNWLQTAASMGVIGLVALLHWIARLYLALFHSLRPTRSKPGDDARFRPAVGIGALLALTGFLVHGTLEWNLGDSEVITTLYLIVGIAVARGVRERQTESPESPLS